MQFINYVKQHRKNTTILVFVIAIAVVIIGIVIANFQSNAYKEAKTNWEKSVATKASAKNDTYFSKKIIVGRLETTEESNAQKSDCDANTQRLNSFEKNNKGPSLNFNPFGVFSSSYRSAAKNDKDVQTKEEIIRQTISSMNDYRDICEYYNSGIEIARKETNETESAKQYKLYVGTDQQKNQSCSISGCLPEDRTLWPKLADIYAGYVTSSKSYVKLYQDSCFSSTYKKVCELNASYYAQKAKNQEKYNDAIRNGSPIYAGINATLTKKYDRLILNAYKEVKGTVLPESGDPESTVLKSLMQNIETKIDANLKQLSKV